MTTIGSSSELTLERVQKAVNSIIDVLGEPQTALHRQAIAAFQEGDYRRCTVGNDLSKYWNLTMLEIIDE